MQLDYENTQQVTVAEKVCHEGLQKARTTVLSSCQLLNNQPEHLILCSHSLQ